MSHWLAQQSKQRISLSLLCGLKIAADNFLLPFLFDL
jgi:hypothetical protein